MAGSSIDSNHGCAVLTEVIRLPPKVMSNMHHLALAAAVLTFIVTSERY